MKKMLFLVAIAWAVTINIQAQSSTVATLNHNDTITSYYGYSALQEAHAAAVDGDVITLSAGSFGATNISKGITLRGAGMGVGDTAEPTVIVGNFTVNVSGLDGVNKKLSFEGIYSNNNLYFYRGGTGSYDSRTYWNISFIKCRFNYLKTENYNDYNNTWEGRAILQNAVFLHCYIMNGFSFNYSTNCSFINCYIRKPGISSSAVFDFQNCVIWEDESRNFFQNSTFTNCIIYSTTTDTGHKFNANNTAKYCVVVSDSVNVLDNISDTSNKFVTSLADVFKNFRGTYADNITFELTDAAKTQYLGMDGTQVGIYGGDFAFDPAPSTPRITKCVVAPKSTADGKLKVTITVSATE